MTLIDEIVAIIVSVADPDRIILFGSRARGDHNEKSDVDLLIIKKNLPKPRELNRRIYRAFFDSDVDTSVDVLSIDIDRYETLKNRIGYIYKTIEREGKTVYEK